MERDEFLAKREEEELAKLHDVFKELDENILALNKSLIGQAARIKALQDWLWLDLKEHGTTELFRQSDKVPPYERERASAKHYATYSKLYSTIVKQLVDLLPKEAKEDAKRAMDINEVLK